MAQKTFPVIGFGTWVDIEGNEDPSTMEGVVEKAVEVGYRFFDTGHEYKTEEYVVKGIYKKLTRNEVLIGSKHQAPLQSAELLNHIKQTQVGHYDVYLLHIPPKINNKEEFTQDLLAKWRIIDEYYRKDITKHVGVSNFYKFHIDELLSLCEKHSLTPPKFNQLEIHPVCQEKEYVKYLKDLKLEVIAHTPLGNLACNMIFENEDVKAVASQLGATPAQAVLASTIARGINVIPRATQVAHMKDNLEALNFVPKITDSHFATLASVDISNNLVDLAIDAKEHNDRLG